MKEMESYEAKAVEEEAKEMGNVEKVMGSSKETVQLWSNRSAAMETNSITPAPDQLTIFYGGRVVVFDGIPADKVREIMLVATAAAAKTAEVKKNVSATPACAPVLSRSPSLQSTSSALASPQGQFYPVHQSSLCKLQAELPIARRHSLQRFFEKRRDRLVSKNPYPTTPGGKASETKANLSAEASPEEGCSGKPIASEEELQHKATVNLV